MEGSGSYGSSCGWQYPGAVRDPVAGFYEGVLWDYPVVVYLLLTLLIAPLVEEGIFRRGIYAVFRRWLGVTPAAFLSALAFGLYHGNWIQGIYGFVFGLLLAWGYESSSFGKYRMVVLMHGAANGAAVLCSMVFSGLF